MRRRAWTLPAWFSPGHRCSDFLNTMPGTASACGLMAEVGAKVGHAFIDLRYFHSCSLAVSTAIYFAGQLALGSAKFPGVLPNESRVLYLDAIRQCEVGSQT